MVGPWKFTLLEIGNGLSINLYSLCTDYTTKLSLTSTQQNANHSGALTSFLSSHTQFGEREKTHFSQKLTSPLKNMAQKLQKTPFSTTKRRQQRDPTSVLSPLSNRGHTGSLPSQFLKHTHRNTLTRKIPMLRQGMWLKCACVSNLRRITEKNNRTDQFSVPEKDRKTRARACTTKTWLYCRSAGEFPVNWRESTRYGLRYELWHMYREKFEEMGGEK